MDYFEMERNRYNGGGSGSGGALGIGGRISPVIKYLLIINLAVFLIQSVLYIFGGIKLYNLFGLVPYYLLNKFFIWQPLTYMFLHGGVFHLFWNLLALWMFGGDVEGAMGSRKFLRFYILSGLFAGLCGVVFQFNSMSPVVGASGAIYGILAAFGMLFPEREITMLLFFVLPVKAKAKYFVIGFALITFFQCLWTSFGGIDYLTHLGGLLFGYLYFKDFFGLREKIEGFPESIFKKRKNKDDIPKSIYISEEVDPILEKISRDGIHSLTRREKKILDKAKDKL